MGRERWGEAVACCAWTSWGRRVPPPAPASCQPGDTRVVGAAFLRLPLVLAAHAAVVAGDWAGAGSPRDSASSWRRVLITPLRDAIWRGSDAIIVCLALGGWGGAAGQAHRPHFIPWSGSGCAPPPRRWLRADCPQGKEQRRTYGRKDYGVL